MINGWSEGFLAGIQTFNQILTAGIAIPAFSLFLYALSFNLRDRVARSFAVILLCVVVVFIEALRIEQSHQASSLLACSGSVSHLPRISAFIGCLLTAGRPSPDGGDYIPGLFLCGCFLVLLFRLSARCARGGRPHTPLKRTYGLRFSPCVTSPP
jgi:hypothetical protein